MRAFPALFLFWPALLLARPAAADVLAQWVQLGPDASASVRVIADGACPAVAFDGAATAMRVRAEPDAKFANVPAAPFAVRSCEAEIPANAKSAAIGGRTLPLPHANPQRILVFGDTGCRLKLPDQVQDCNDPRSWPFAKIVASAAAAKPDLVIHVGDYHYREDACPAGRAGCAGTPYGYGWDAWNVDFFAPAAPLLATAPWVMVRGNHEDCERAGEGWFRFLDRAPMASACRDLTGIFVSRLGDFGIVNVDGAFAVDPKKDPDSLVALLRQQLGEISGKIPADAWLATHRPLDAMRGNKEKLVTDNQIQEAAFGADMPRSIHMLVSGHIHFFQANDFGGEHPPQLVVGMGGDDLEPQPQASLVGATINGNRVVSSTTYSGYGYMIWDKQGAVWVGALYDTDGGGLGTCRLEGRSLACMPD
jgi:predicted phosphodiesterase